MIVASVRVPTPSRSSLAKNPCPPHTWMTNQPIMNMIAKASGDSEVAVPDLATRF